MNEQVKTILAYLTPAIFWLVRRLLPVVSGLLLKLGVDNEQFVTIAAGVITFLVSCVLMWLHNKLIAKSAAYHATHYERRSL